MLGIPNNLGSGVVRVSGMHLKVLSFVLALALLGTACSDSTTPSTLEGAAADIYGGDCAAATGDEVTIYSGRKESLIGPVLEAFGCETGIDVAVRWAGSTDLALLLSEEGDNTPADIFLSRSPGPVGFLEAQGLLQQVDGDVLGLVPDEYQSANGNWVGFSGRKRVMVYNTDDVAADELPNSVFDLTDERWRGKVAIPATNGSFLDWFTVFRDQQGTDVAVQWLEDMVANDARYYADNRSIVEAAARGEVEVGLVNHYYTYQYLADLGDDHKALNFDFPGEDIGSALIITAATVTASSEHSDEANALLEYLLSEPVQQYLTDSTFEYPLAAGVEPADVLPELGGLEIGTVDFDALGGDFEETTLLVEATGIQNQ